MHPKSIVSLAGIGVAIVGVSIAAAHDTYTGYSGAPGSTGTCSITCHGRSGGTITATGFPSSYTPGSLYTVTIGRNGDSAIINFNASCRIGDSSVNAGTIAAGTGTSTYNVKNETNGAHFTNSFGNASGTFTWTAPAKGTGTVKLYVAGLQGNASSGVINGGPTNALVLPSTESAASVVASDAKNAPPLFFCVVAGHKAIFPLPAGFAPREGQRCKLFDTRGNEIHVPLTGNATSIMWSGTDYLGRALSAGAYFFTLRQGRSVLFVKILVTR